MFFRNFLHFLWQQRGMVIWFFFLCLFAFIWMWFARDTISDYLKSRRQRNQVRNEVERLEEEIQRSRHEKEVLQRGSFESEKVAREKFRLSKPGEKVLYLQKAPLTSDSDELTSRAIRMRELLAPDE
ncbi:MAG: FtsB family cell division protein [Candidatus Sumerlaeia bacterium]